jgi:hypothetical protein
MKRFLAVILCTAFLVSQSGIVIGMHWCRGKLAGVSLSLSETHSCRCGKKPMKAGCCKDKQVTLKTKAQAVKTGIVNPKSGQTLVKTTFFYSPLIQPVITGNAGLTRIWHPPPIRSKVPIFLSEKVFRI